jgi:hypothetical protein
MSSRRSALIHGDSSWALISYEHFGLGAMEFGNLVFFPFGTLKCMKSDTKVLFRLFSLDMAIFGLLV